MLEWRIYYVDGSDYSNEDGPAWLARKWGVAAIAVFDPAVGYIILTGSKECDFFCYDATWDSPVWRNSNVFGFNDYMKEPGMRLVLFGGWIGDHGWQALKGRVQNELGDRQRYPDAMDR